ncbi:MAG: hypothetical protein LC792_05615 [Actinobacteria bacterium]|nr:hypothetical protein [Actinomycetota bacterium]
MAGESRLRWLGERAVRHWRWGRAHGLGRLIEEDGLDPFTRVPNACRRWWWRRSHAPAPGSAAPVFLVGVQRSGTNMVVQAFEAAPEVEVHNENDRRAFDRFRLRPDATVRAIVEASRHRLVLFKPLCDSHRVDHLLDGLATPAPGRAIWAYRSVDGRVRSALAKFGDANLQALRRIAAGDGDGMWQAQRLSQESLDLVASFDWDAMSPASAAALFWLVRNSLYFELGLDRRPDVVLCSYEGLLAQPAVALGRLCTFLGLAWHPRLAAHIAPRGTTASPSLDIDPRIRSRCTELALRLDQAKKDHDDRLGRQPGGPIQKLG